MGLFLLVLDGLEIIIQLFPGAHHQRGTTETDLFQERGTTETDLFQERGITMNAKLGYVMGCLTNWNH